MPDHQQKKPCLDAARKAHYVPPRILSRESLESIAAVCSSGGTAISKESLGAFTPNGPCGLNGGVIRS